MSKKQEPQPLTVADVQRYLILIKRLDTLPKDYDRAHYVEDELHRTVLQAIADGNPDAQALAREALRSTEYEFPRRYA